MGFLHRLFCRHVWHERYRYQRNEDEAFRQVSECSKCGATKSEPLPLDWSPGVTVPDGCKLLRINADGSILYQRTSMGGGWAS